MSVKCPSCGHRFELAASLEGFEEWWAAYPRKEKKGLARRAFTIALAKTTPDRLLIGAKHYARKTANQPPQYIMLPSSWLNAESWTDADVPTTDEPPSVDLDVSWSFEKHQMMLNLIGEPKFRSWFQASRIEHGDYTIIIVPKEFHRRWIERNFARELNQVFGLFEVRVG
jgi:hypothetical protein